LSLMIIWQIITISLVKTAIRALRLIGRHGTALPGLIAESMHPGLLKKLSSELSGGAILVTGTNGKTTTSKMLRGLLEGRGLKVLANRSGSNFTRGILASLIEHATISGRLNYDMAVLEVDEAYCRLVARQVSPKNILVLNVMRDQLDRYGEIDTTAKLIGEALRYTQSAVLNANDPPVASLEKHINDDRKTTFYGVSPQLKKNLPTDEELLSGSLKTKHEPPEPDVILYDFQPEKDNLARVMVGGNTYTFNLRFGGVHNAQNATAALAAVYSLTSNIGTKDMKTLSNISPAFGRGEDLLIRGVKTQLALVKNPSGFNQNIRTFASNPEVGAILILINDRYADSRDVSWLWDANMEPLKTSQAKFVAGGIRAYDMALRLQYENIAVADIQTSIRLALKSAVDQTPKGKKLLILPTYTAMLEVRKLLSKTAELEKIWR